MNTAIARTTFYSRDPATKQKRKHSFELRRLKKPVVKTDKKGRETVYVYGIWSDGDWTEYLTEPQAIARLQMPTGEELWDDINWFMVRRSRMAQAA